ncbi:MAG: hypothetical protein K1X31_13620 [Gemmatimonadaceae bacterium]|nr:hypothetical protein [Gemmatimonadaceae bacterium]
MRQLFIIRLALVTGVLLFAGLTTWMRTSGQLPEPAEDLRANLVYFRYATWAVAAFALLWALFWKARAEAAMTESGVHRALIIGWAPGEATALLGTVTYFQGGEPASMAFGVLAFLVVLLILRIPAPPR